MRSGPFRGRHRARLLGVEARQDALGQRFPIGACGRLGFRIARRTTDNTPTRGEPVRGVRRLLQRLGACDRALPGSRSRPRTA